MGTSVPTRVNNTSEEEDYDGRPKGREGITCYIHATATPKQHSYLQGMDCNRQGYLAHDTRHLEMDECQEVVEEWTEPGPVTPQRSAYLPSLATADTKAVPSC